MSLYNIRNLCKRTLGQNEEKELLIQIKVKRLSALFRMRELQNDVLNFLILQYSERLSSCEKTFSPDAYTTLSRGCGPL